MKDLFKTRLASNHPDFKQVYASALATQQTLNSQMEELDAELNPEATIKTLKATIEREQDSAKRLELANRLAMFQSASVQLQASANADVAACSQLLEFGVRKMLSTALTAIEQERDADVTEEKQWFAKFGMAHTPTAVSARWSKLRAEIASYLASLDEYASKLALSTPRKDMFSAAFAIFA
jgi:hypothetical protein